MGSSSLLICENIYRIHCRIWEGTTTVLALDIARATRNSNTVSAFVTVSKNPLSAFHTDCRYQWANETISACPPDLEQDISLSLEIIRLALEELVRSYQHPIPPLVPRPALILLGHLACCVYLFEHAMWSYSTGEPTSDIDVEVFIRWTVEGGTLAAIYDVKRAKESSGKRELANSAIVFGSSKL